MREPTDPFLASKPKLSQIPFQPWARALFDNRVQIRNEPYVRCKPSAGARQVATAYGTQLVEDREHKRFYIFETGGAHSFRNDLHGWPGAPVKLIAQLPRTLGRALGRRHAGRRYGRFQ